MANRVSQGWESENTSLPCKAWSEPLQRMFMSQEALLPLTYISPSLSQLGDYPRGAPGIHLLPILTRVQKELDQTSLLPITPFSSHPHL